MIPHDIPTEGLHEVLSAWSGRGQLWEALAATRLERRWTPADVRRRAHRVLLQELTPDLAALPSTLRQWQDRLPARSHRRRTETASPVGGVDWAETYRAHGWPPRTLVARPRRKTADQRLLEASAWTLRRLHDIVVDARNVEATAGKEAEQQIGAALRLLDSGVVDHGPDPQTPTSTSLRLLRSTGWPWRAVARLADRLIALDRAGLRELAAVMVAPDADLRARLFHLGILGEVLLAFRDAGLTVVSRRPLTAAVGGGPAYTAEGPEETWDIWYEAAGAWSYYDVTSSYREVTAEVPGRDGTLGPDVLVVDARRDRAFLVECKYSYNPDYAVRDGYLQTLAYAAEVRSRLAQQVTALLTAPDPVVGTGGAVSTVAGAMSVAGSGRVRSHLRSWLET